MSKPTGNPRGRPRGTKNKPPPGIIMAQRDGVTPLEFLLDIMDDKTESIEVRKDAAKSAAPYVHPRLAQTQLEVTGDITYDKIEREIVKPETTNG
jgi:hypothetical protein